MTVPHKIPPRPGAPKLYTEPFENIPNGKYYLESQYYANDGTVKVEVMEDQHGKQWVYFERSTQNTIKIVHLDSKAKLYPRTD